MAMTTQEIVQDPTFLGLPEQEQDKVLSAVDKTYGTLPIPERAKALQGLRNLPQREQAPVAASSPSSPPSTPPINGMTQIGQEIGKGLQIAGASLIRGLATIPGLPSDLAEMTVNALIAHQELNAGNSTLVNTAQSLSPLTFDALKVAQRKLSGTPLTSQFVNFPGGTEEIVNALPESLKVPKDLSPFQRIASTAIEVQGSALLPIALASKLLSFADPRKMVQIETALAASGGIVMGSVRELVGEGPLSDFVSLAVGTLGPQMLMKAIGGARKLALKVSGQVSDTALKEEIGKRFTTMTTTEELQAGIERNATLKRDIPLFSPTTGQTSGSPGLMQSERAFQRTSSEQANKATRTLESNQAAVGEFLRTGSPEGTLDATVKTLESAFTRDTAMIDSSLMRAQGEVDAARQKVSLATDRLMQQADVRANRAEIMAQDRVNAMEGRITNPMAGQILREEYGKELTAFTDAAQARYAEVPDFAFSPAGLKKRIKDIKDDFGVEIQGPAASGLGKLSRIIPDAAAETSPVGFRVGEAPAAKPEPTTTFHEMHQARNEVRRLRREAVAAHDDKSAYQLGRINEAIMDTMDDMKLAPPPGTEGAVESLKAVDSWYGKQVVRLKSGEVNALRFKDKWGRFTTSDEDVAAKFLSGETPVNDFVQALGGRPSARAALESFTERLFTEKAIYPDLHPKAGMVNVKAAAKFVQQHEAALKQFPDVQRKIEGAVQWENIAAKYRAESDAILKNPDAVTRLRNPILTGDVDELTRRHSELLALRDRTVKEWEKSTASDFMGLDADRAAQTIVRSTKPNAMLADLSKRIGTDRDAQNGLNKALWDAALDKFSSERLDLLDNRALLTTKMTKFLRENEEWMTSRFGAERVSHMRKSADALTILDRTGRPVLPGGSDTMANLSSAMVDWGPFFSRLYAEQSGRIGTAWLISERIGRVIGGLLKSQSEQGAMHLLEQAFYDPHVAQTWMLAAKQGEQHLLEQRLRHILVPKLYGALPLVENGQQSTGP